MIELVFAVIVAGIIFCLAPFILGIVLLLAVFGTIGFAMWQYPIFAEAVAGLLIDGAVLAALYGCYALIAWSVRAVRARRAA